MTLTMTRLPKLYYISQGRTPEEHIKGIEKVCLAGCKLVQLRLKNLPSKIIEKTAIIAKEVCDKHNTKLVINDYSKIAKNILNAGIHVGKNDDNLADLKKTLSSVLVGGTANTIDDCVKLYREGADYIGLGPFAFTSTKSNLDPIIGIAGYKDIIIKLKSLKIEMPIYAIGGITETNIPDLLELGVHGVAISGLFANKTEKEIKKIIDLYE